MNLWQRSKWIYTPTFDLIFILLPSFLVSAAVVAFPTLFEQAKSLPLWWWLVLVVGIDVAHVYSTLFRTYLDPEERKDRETLLTIVPIACWIVGVMIYYFSSRLFWTLLAYLAVFHFVRQQYGFMVLYGAKEGLRSPYSRLVDRLVIYLATLSPLVYWHVNLPREFSWFVEGDFVPLSSPLILTVANYCYALLIGLYLLKELAWYLRQRTISLGKQLLLVGTMLSWHLGIVVFNGDMAFTLTNVVSHGIPYIALVWAYERKRVTGLTSANRFGCSWQQWLFQPRRLPVYLLVLFLLAYFEEGVWDVLVWRDHCALFGGCFGAEESLSKATLSWLIPLLALPQATHYVLDAFIWRVRRPDSGFRDLVFSADSNESSSD